MHNLFQRFFFLFKEYIVLVILLLASLSVISFNDSSSVKSIRTISIGGFAVLSSVTDAVTGIFSSDDELLEQKRLNARLMLKLNLLQEAARENNKLAGMLAFKDTTSYPLVAAKVVSKMVNAAQGSYVINSGLSDSVKTGMPVITEAGLAGIVHNVSSGYSYVRTLQNTRLKVAVEDTRSGVNGVLAWNGRNVIMKNIPSTFDITRDDTVVTSGYSTIVPPRIPVGVVTKIEKTTSGLLTDVTIKPFVDFVKLKSVFVLQVITDKQVDSLKLNLLAE